MNGYLSRVPCSRSALVAQTVRALSDVYSAAGSVVHAVSDGLVVNGHSFFPLVATKSAQHQGECQVFFVGGLMSL
jgi:hypothetical protein